MQWADSAQESVSEMPRPDTLKDKQALIERVEADMVRQGKALEALRAQHAEMASVGHPYAAKVPAKDTQPSERRYKKKINQFRLVAFSRFRCRNT